MANLWIGTSERKANTRQAGVIYLDNLSVSLLPPVQGNPIGEWRDEEVASQAQKAIAANPQQWALIYESGPSKGYVNLDLSIGISFRTEDNQQVAYIYVGEGREVTVRDNDLVRKLQDQLA
jgi:hypothetical protein